VVPSLPELFTKSCWNELTGPTTEGNLAEPSRGKVQPPSRPGWAEKVLQSCGPLKGPRVHFKGPRGPFKGTRGPLKGPRVHFKGPRGLVKGPGVL